MSAQKPQTRRLAATLDARIDASHVPEFVKRLQTLVTDAEEKAMLSVIQLTPATVIPDPSTVYLGQVVVSLTIDQSDADLLAAASDAGVLVAALRRLQLAKTH